MEVFHGQSLQVDRLLRAPIGCLGMWSSILRAVRDYNKVDE